MSTNYKRELSKVEKEFLANSLKANQSVQTIVDYFTKEGFIEDAQFNITEAVQLQTAEQGGTVTEIALGDTAYVWYSNFTHVEHPENIEQVIGVIVDGGKEKQFEIVNNSVQLINEAEVIETTAKEDTVTPQDNCFIHGNWCGPGCSGPSAPVDATDRCCMYHDKCYEANGYFSCECDWNVLDCLRGVSGFAAGIVRAYFVAAQVAGACS
ncbi:hypothetical protein ACN9MH_03175 [Paenibacillus silvae]|jgi:hypothetical protein|uniref:hypothetical protein n=1 Tax=Paenibacillus TaxID=44249 RepID=UPI001C101637|nr:MULTISPECIES: hypothetical protein [Paenibacillus]MBU5356065.1 hypothetical protein [Paenibacillus barcinonensis]MDM5280062.1 hypothetical protein [Paenibacillus silvae]